MKAFMAALESLGKDPLQIGEIPPTPEIVNQFFNDSTGTGDDGEIDTRGPWNEGDGFHIVEAPARRVAEATQEEVSREINRAGSRRSGSTASAQPRSKRIR
jgi:Mn-containing catalase